MKYTCNEYMKYKEIKLYQTPDKFGDGPNNSRKMPLSIEIHFKKNHKWNLEI